MPEVCETLLCAVQEISRADRPSIDSQLPWDVLLVVFSLSDAPTLAVLGRVALDFLEVALPLLYTEVEVTSVEELEGLFSKRNESETVSSHLLRFLSYLLRVTALP